MLSPEIQRRCASCEKLMGEEDSIGRICAACLLSGLEGDQRHQADSDFLEALFPQLEKVHFLAEGGMGEIFKAHHRHLDRDVAVKVLRSEPRNDVFRERFVREARAMAKLEHPNIAQVHDFLEEGGEGYLILEFVDGVSLATILAEKGKLPQREAVRIASQIAKAIAYAHEQGVVHRDLKSSNILIRKGDGAVKVVDFGIAKLTENESGTRMLETATGSMLGTPQYMAPEQRVPGQTVDHRADIFALGVILYEMLTGEVPMGRFRRPSKKSATVEPWLDKVTLRALDESPNRRFQSAVDLDSALVKGPKTLRRWMLVGALIALLAMVPLAKRAIAPSSGPLVLAEAGVNKREGIRTNSLGMEMLDFPSLGLSVCRWETRVQDFQRFVQENPNLVLEQTISLKAPEPNALDRNCWHVGNYSWDRLEYEQEDDHPVVGIGFRTAELFCLWLTDLERSSGTLDAGQAYRLPTEDEWRKFTSFKSTYPWGDDWETNLSGEAMRFNLAGNEVGVDSGWPSTFRFISGYQDAHLRTAPVDAYPEDEATGLYGLVGNVSEWCQKNVETPMDYVPVAGYSWSSGRRENLFSRGDPNFGHSAIGFRIVLELR